MRASQKGSLAGTHRAAKNMNGYRYNPNWAPLENSSDDELDLTRDVHPAFMAESRPPPLVVQADRSAPRRFISTLPPQKYTVAPSRPISRAGSVHGGTNAMQNGGNSGARVQDMSSRTLTAPAYPSRSASVTPQMHRRTTPPYTATQQSAHRPPSQQQQQQSASGGLVFGGRANVAAPPPLRSSWAVDAVPVATLSAPPPRRMSSASFQTFCDDVPAGKENTRPASAGKQQQQQHQQQQPYSDATSTATTTATTAETLRSATLTMQSVAATTIAATPAPQVRSEPPRFRTVTEVAVSSTNALGGWGSPVVTSLSPTIRAAPATAVSGTTTSAVMADGAAVAPAHLLPKPTTSARNPYESCALATFGDLDDYDGSVDCTPRSKSPLTRNGEPAPPVLESSPKRDSRPPIRSPPGLSRRMSPVKSAFTGSLQTVSSVTQAAQKRTEPYQQQQMSTSPTGSLQVVQTATTVISPISEPPPQEDSTKQKPVGDSGENQQQTASTPLPRQDSLESSVEQTNELQPAKVEATRVNKQQQEQQVQSAETKAVTADISQNWAMNDNMAAEIMAIIQKHRDLAKKAASVPDAPIVNPWDTDSEAVSELYRLMVSGSANSGSGGWSDSAVSLEQPSIPPPTQTALSKSTIANIMRGRRLEELDEFVSADASISAVSSSTTPVPSTDGMQTPVDAKPWTVDGTEMEKLRALYQSHHIASLKQNADTSVEASTTARNLGITTTQLTNICPEKAPVQQAPKLLTIATTAATIIPPTTEHTSTNLHATEDALESVKSVSSSPPRSASSTTGSVIRKFRVFTPSAKSYQDCGVQTDDLEQEKSVASTKNCVCPPDDRGAEIFTVQVPLAGDETFNLTVRENDKPRFLAKSVRLVMSGYSSFDAAWESEFEEFLQQLIADAISAD